MTVSSTFDILARTLFMFINSWESMFYVSSCNVCSFNKLSVSMVMVAIAIRTRKSQWLIWVYHAEHDLIKLISQCRLSLVNLINVDKTKISLYFSMPTHLFVVILCCRASIKFLTHSKCVRITTSPRNNIKGKQTLFLETIPWRIVA